jgi:hypothetical protein
LKLDAIGCARRAIVNSWANWELLIAQWVLGAVGLLLVLAGFAPLLWTFVELPALREIFSGDPARVLRDLGGLAALKLPGWGAVLSALVLATLAWTMSLWVFCFLSAGTYGTLMAGERQAPRGVGSPPPWRTFRTFEVGNFIGWGRRYVWRYFWAVQLFVAIGCGWLLGFSLVVLAAVWAGQGWGAVAAIGVGCGGALPLVFLGFVTAFWYAIAAAELARETSGVWVAMRNGLTWLGRRPGTVLLLFLMQLAASLAVGMVFTPISMLGSFAMADAPGGDLALQLPLGFIQWMVSTAVALATSAAYVAFVRDTAEDGRAGLETG